MAQYKVPQDVEADDKLIEYSCDKNRQKSKKYAKIVA